MPIDHASGTPLYRQIANDLREAIRMRKLAPGERLPSESELIDQYGVARTTVRLAIRQLAADGLVYTSHGRGTFVSERPPLRLDATRSHSRERLRLTTTDTYQADLKAQPIERTGYHTIEVEILDNPSDDVAARLEVEEGTSVFVRRRVHFVDDLPSHIGDTYYPYDLVRGSDIETPGQLDRGGNRVLEELGHAVLRRTDEISVRMPTPQEANLLQIAGGVPVMETLRTGYDNDDRPVALYYGVWPGDRHVMIYNVRT
jgi:GntR family transcriptional regulator